MSIIRSGTYARQTLRRAPRLLADKSTIAAAIEPSTPSSHLVTLREIDRLVTSIASESTSDL